MSHGEEMAGLQSGWCWKWGPFFGSTQAEGVPRTARRLETEVESGSSWRGRCALLKGCSPAASCPQRSCCQWSLLSMNRPGIQRPDFWQLCLHTQVVLVVKNLPANIEDLRDMGSILGWGRSPGGGHSNSLQCSCLENPMDRGVWWAIVHGVTKSHGRSVTTDTHLTTNTHTHTWLVNVSGFLGWETQSQKGYMWSGGQRGQSGLTLLGDPRASVVNKINK